MSVLTTVFIASFLLNLVYSKITDQRFLISNRVLMGVIAVIALISYAIHLGTAWYGGWLTELIAITNRNYGILFYPRIALFFITLILPCFYFFDRWRQNELLSNSVGVLILLIFIIELSINGWTSNYVYPGWHTTINQLSPLLIFTITIFLSIAINWLVVRFDSPSNSKN